MPRHFFWHCLPQPPVGHVVTKRACVRSSQSAPVVPPLPRGSCKSVDWRSIIIRSLRSSAARTSTAHRKYSLTHDLKRSARFRVVFAMFANIRPNRMGLCVLCFAHSRRVPFPVLHVTSRNRTNRENQLKFTSDVPSLDIIEYYGQGQTESAIAYYSITIPLKAYIFYTKYVHGHEWLYFHVFLTFLMI